MFKKQTIQDVLNQNAEKVAAWEESHNETTYKQYKPYLKMLWVFVTTSLGIWLKALLTGKMSLKNIGLVLVTSIPLYIMGYYVGIYVWAGLGVTIFYIGHWILWGTILLLLPVNGIKFMFWLLIFGLSNSNTTTTTTTTTYYVDDDGNKYDEFGNDYY